MGAAEPLRETESETFLRVWFSVVPEGSLLEIRPLHKRPGARSKPQSWHKTQASAQRAIDVSLRNGDDVYVGVLPRTRENGTTDAVGARCWLWADVDYGTVGHAQPSVHSTRQEAINAVNALAIKPTFTVDSGGGLHLWWALREPANEKDWRSALDRVVFALKADASATDPPRILRVPGTKNFKTSSPRPVRLLDHSECWHELTTFLSLPEPPAPKYSEPELLATASQNDGPFARANDVPIANVLAWLGVPTHLEGSRTYCACPVCPGNDVREMVVGGRSNVATCFGDCGTHSYTVVDLVAAVRGIEPRKAVELLAAEFHFDAFAPATTDEWEPFVPLDEPPRPKFPQGVLQGPFERFVEELATETQTPRDLPAMLVLAAVSCACARRFEVRVNAGYSEPLNLFVVVALPPGSRKSAVVNAVLKPFEAEEFEAARNRPKPASKQARSKASKKAQEPAGEAEEEQDTQPPLRLVVDDATPEALALRLAEQGGRLGLFSAEGGGFFELLAGRYSGERGAAIEVYLKSHAGDTLKTDRIQRTGELIVRPALTVGVTTQPDTLRTLAASPGARSRGLIARFLFSVPTPNIGYRRIDAPAMQRETRSEYARNIRRLLSVKTESTNEALDPQPRELLLSESAREVYNTQAQRFEERQRPDGDLEPLREWATKLLGAVLRIAGVLHMADHAQDDEPWSLPIEADTLERAFHLADEYLVPHAKLALSIMSDSESIEAARRLLTWMVKNKLTEFSVRDAHRALGAKGERGEAIDPALGVLESHGYIRPAVVIASEGRTRSGRPRGLRYLVHPKL